MIIKPGGIDPDDKTCSLSNDWINNSSRVHQAVDNFDPALESLLSSNRYIVMDVNSCQDFYSCMLCQVIRVTYSSGPLTPVAKTARVRSNFHTVANTSG